VSEASVGTCCCATLDADSRCRSPSCSLPRPATSLGLHTGAGFGARVRASALIADECLESGEVHVQRSSVGDNRSGCRVHVSRLHPRRFIVRAETARHASSATMSLLPGAHLSAKLERAVRLRCMQASMQAITSSLQQCAWCCDIENQSRCQYKHRAIAATADDCPRLERLDILFAFDTQAGRSHSQAAARARMTPGVVRFESVLSQVDTRWLAHVGLQLSPEWSSSFPMGLQNEGIRNPIPAFPVSPCRSKGRTQQQRVVDNSASI
jgi:hypothetical protein